jgi:hypothetical protein
MSKWNFESRFYILQACTVTDKQYFIVRLLWNTDTVAAEGTFLQMFRMYVILIKLRGLSAVRFSFFRFFEQSIIYTLPIENRPKYHLRPIQL